VNSNCRGTGRISCHERSRRKSSCSTGEAAAEEVAAADNQFLIPQFDLNVNKRLQKIYKNKERKLT